MSKRSIFLLMISVLFATAGVVNGQLPGVTKPLGTNPSPELVGQLTKQLNIKPEQAIGGPGA